MINPVFRRETQTLMRTFRTFLAMMIYVGVLLLVAFVFVQASSNSYTGFQPQSAIYLYWALGAFQIGLVMMIAPVFAGSAISGERERQTLDLMLVTKMSHARIIRGKLSSSLIVVLLMIVASMPVFSIILYYGGMSVLNLLALIAYTLLMAALAGSIAIFFSAWTRKTLVSIVVSGSIIMLLTIGNLIGMLVINALNYGTNSAPIAPWFNKLMLGLNPGVGYFSIMDSQFGSGTIDALVWEFSRYQQNTTYGFDFWQSVPMWAITCVFAVVVSAACLFGATKCLDTNRKSKKGA
jgi:ABC-type transport system involved in multi-copper enzyme maturation permease subunit